MPWYNMPPLFAVLGNWLDAALPRSGGRRSYRATAGVSATQARRQCVIVHLAAGACGETVMDTAVCPGMTCRSSRCASTCTETAEPAGLGNWSAEHLDQGRMQAYPATSTLHTARDTNRVVTVTPGFCCLNKLI